MLHKKFQIIFIQIP